MTPQKRKPNAFCDFNDVTLGSSAVFEKQKSYGSAGKTENEESDKSTVTRSFPTPSYDGFGFIMDYK
jgi:hypothetical protein